MYWIEELSASEVAKTLGFPHESTVNRLLEEYGIPKRSLKETAGSSRTKAKKSQTLFERTGVTHNFCFNSPSRIAWQERLLQEEGITNVFQREAVKRKSAATIVKKYSVEQVHQLSTRLSYGKKVFSALHREVCLALEEHKIAFMVEAKLLDCRGKRYLYCYDILLTGTKKLIEVNGDYWHGNPSIYKSTDLIMKGSSKEITVGEKWKADSEKLAAATQAGYEVLIVWEKDWKTEKKATLQRILDYESKQNSIDNEIGRKT